MVTPKVRALAESKCYGIHEIELPSNTQLGFATTTPSGKPLEENKISEERR